MSSSLTNTVCAASRRRNARTTVQGVTTTGGRVVTLAGQREEGERDGEGDETEFNQPDGVAIAADGSMYIVDAVSCRLRRASPAAKYRAECDLFVSCDKCHTPFGLCFV